MNDYIRCECCGWIGTEDDCDTRRVREFDGLNRGPYRYSVYNLCPDCGCDEFFDVTVCVDCEASGVLHEANAEDDDERCAEHAAEHRQCEAEASYDAMMEQRALDADGDAPCVRGLG